MFVGFAQLDSAFSFPVLTVNASNVPVNSSTTPTYRVYGNSGLMPSGTGSLTNKESGTVTGATNASPIVITAASHGLTTGMSVTIASVGGNTAANGVFTITAIDASTFSLDGSTGNGAYTAATGTWKTTGYMQVSFTPTAANGYAAGEWYDVLVVATISGSTVEYPFRFGCI